MKEWRSLLGLTAGLALTVVFVLVTQSSPFVRGLFLGATSVFWIGLVWLWALIGSGQLRHFWGRSGERATAEELGSKRHRRAGWSVVHGLVVRGHEIDHVAVGPGGVLAVETKWVGGERWTVAGGRLHGPIGDPIFQARRSATRVSELLRSATGVGHKVDVQPVLMIWGPGCPVISTEDHEVDGVQVFTGRGLEDLRTWLAHDRLEHEQVAAIRTALEAYAEAQQRASDSTAATRRPVG